MQPRRRPGLATASSFRVRDWLSGLAQELKSWLDPEPARAERSKLGLEGAGEDEPHFSPTFSIPSAVGWGAAAVGASLPPSGQGRRSRSLRLGKIIAVGGKSNTGPSRPLTKKTN